MLNNKIIFYLFILILLLLPLYLMIPRINLPSGPDETAYVVIIERIAAHQPIDFIFSPLLYPAIASLLVTFFGTGIAVIRLLGIVLFFATGIIGIYILKNICPKITYQKIALFCMIYFLHPLAMQGAQMIDIDNTLLPFTLLLFIHALISFDSSKYIQWLYLIASLTILLCTKLTTPSMIIFSLLIYTWYKRNTLISFKQIILIAILSLTSFLFIWYAATTMNNWDFHQPFSYIFMRSKISLAAPMTNWHILGKNIIYLLIWLNPCLLTMLLILIFRPKKIKEEIIALFAIAILTYLFITPIDYGFPKYYIPLISLSAIYITLHIDDVKLNISNKQLIPAILLSSTLLLMFFIAKDSVYMLRYQLRLNTLNAPQITLPCALVIAVIYIVTQCALTYAVYINGKNICKINLPTALCISTIIYNSALAIIQQQAPYATTYNYGETETLKVSSLLKANLAPGMNIIAPSNIAYYAGIWKYQIPSEKINNKKLFLSLIQNNNIGAIVWGVSAFNLDVSKLLLYDKDINNYLLTHFYKTTTGTYKIWLRK